MARLSVTRRGLDADSPLSISITGGSVQTVTAADATVTVAGSTANPTVKVGPAVVRATTTAGAPTTGTWQTDQAIVDSNAAVWICTAGGTPGTWAEGSGGGGGSVTITSPDASIVVAGTSSAPTVEVAAALQADATGALQRSGGTMSGPIAMGASKITGLANGTVASDAAAFGQIPTALPPSGSAAGVLSGTYPNPGLSVSAQAIPSGWTATTQTALDNSTKLSTTAYADTAVGVEKTRALAAEALLAPKASPTFTGTTTAPEFTASGLTGATAASRYVGATTSGAPASGTFAVGDFVIDQTAAVWVCTTAGSPGTWTKAGGSGGTAAFAFGTAAARPAAAGGNANTGYFATDTGEITFSDGSAWHQISAIQVSTSGTLQVGSNNFGGLRVGNSGTMLFSETFGSAVKFTGGDFDVGTAGKGLQVAEGTNAKQGTATLVAGSVVVSNTSVTATSRIFLTSQADGGTPGFLRVSARTAGTSFTVTSSSATDTSVVAYEIFEAG